jgi:hypothetical protein
MSPAPLFSSSVNVFFEIIQDQNTNERRSILTTDYFGSGGRDPAVKHLAIKITVGHRKVERDLPFHVLEASPG